MATARVFFNKADGSFHGYDADKAVLVESVLSPLDAEGTTVAETLEWVFAYLNIGDAPNPQERSLSVGDVVEINGTRYACENIGWKAV
jgi:hypothetical protein